MESLSLTLDDYSLSSLLWVVGLTGIFVWVISVAVKVSRRRSYAKALKEYDALGPKRRIVTRTTAKEMTPLRVLASSSSSSAMQRKLNGPSMNYELNLSSTPLFKAPYVRGTVSKQRTLDQDSSYTPTSFAVASSVDSSSIRPVVPNIVASGSDFNTSSGIPSHPPVASSSATPFATPAPVTSEYQSLIKEQDYQIDLQKQDSLKENGIHEKDTPMADSSFVVPASSTMTSRKKRLLLHEEEYKAVSRPAHSLSLPYAEPQTTKIVKKARQEKGVVTPVQKSKSRGISAPSTRRRSRLVPPSAMGKRKGTFAIDTDVEPLQESSIPQDLRPEQGWITPMSRKLGKRAKVVDLLDNHPLADSAKRRVMADMQVQTDSQTPARVSSVSTANGRVKLTPAPNERASKKSLQTQLQPPPSFVKKPLDDLEADELTVQLLKEAAGMSKEEKRVSFAEPPAVSVKESPVISTTTSLGVQKETTSSANISAPPTVFLPSSSTPAKKDTDALPTFSFSLPEKGSAPISIPLKPIPSLESKDSSKPPEPSAVPAFSFAVPKVSTTAPDSVASAPSLFPASSPAKLFDKSPTTTGITPSVTSAASLAVSSTVPSFNFGSIKNPETTLVAFPGTTAPISSHLSAPLSIPISKEEPPKPPVFSFGAQAPILATLPATTSSASTLAIPSFGVTPAASTPTLTSQTSAVPTATPTLAPFGAPVTATLPTTTTVPSLSSASGVSFGKAAVTASPASTTSAIPSFSSSAPVTSLSTTSAPAVTSAPSLTPSQFSFGAATPSTISTSLPPSTAAPLTFSFNGTTSAPASSSTVPASALGFGTSPAGAASTGLPSFSFGAPPTQTTAASTATTAAPSIPSLAPSIGGFGAVPASPAVPSAQAPPSFNFGGQPPVTQVTSMSAPSFTFGAATTSAPSTQTTSTPVLPPSFGGFGSTSTASVTPSAFGMGSASAPPAIGGFSFGSGGGAAPSTPFGQPSGSTPFGQPSSQTGSTAFGLPTSQTGANAFGQPTSQTGPSAFGQPAAQTGANAFGQPVAQTGSSAFGQPVAQTGSSAFGQPPSQPASNPFGQSAAPSPFGQAFGQSAATPSPFGSQPTSSFSFGQPQPPQHQQTPVASFKIGQSPAPPNSSFTFGAPTPGAPSASTFQFAAPGLPSMPTMPGLGVGGGGTAPPFSVGAAPSSETSGRKLAQPKGRFRKAGMRR